MSHQDVYVWSRDLYLIRAIGQLRPLIAQRGLPLPKRIAVQAAAILPRADGATVLGECWPSRCGGGVPRIVINEAVTDPAVILATLVHELVHAGDDCRDGHGPWFQSWAAAVGLVGHPSTTATPSLARRLQPIERSLGRYPSKSEGYIVSQGRLLVG